MEYTKGKWVARINIHAIDVIQDKTGFGICDIGTIIDLKHADYPINEAKANAELIAAAPETKERHDRMVGVLKECYSFVLSDGRNLLSKQLKMLLEDKIESLLKELDQ